MRLFVHLTICLGYCHASFFYDAFNSLVGMGREEGKPAGSDGSLSSSILGGSKPSAAKPVVYRNMASVDYASAVLQLTLQRTSIDLDDELSRMQYRRRNGGEKEPPASFWRNKSCVVSCKPDENHGVRGSGYVECSVSLEEAGREPEEAIFARYYMYAEEKSNRILVEKKKTTYEMYRAALNSQSQTLATRLPSIHALFSGTSEGRRRFSPFHPSFATFSLPVRTDEEEIICHFVLLPSTHGGIDLATFADQNPSVFYRILYDPQHPFILPPPVRVDPPVSLNNGDHVVQHVKDARQFFGELLGRTNQPLWQVVKKEASGPRVLNGRLINAVLGQLEGIISSDPNVQAIDCSQPLALQTGSTLAPPTTSCLELDLFNRVFFGRTPGLWTIIRSENRAQAFCNSLVSMPIQFCHTTSEFERWLPEASNTASTLQWAKFRISNSMKGLFIIILWDDDLERYAHNPAGKSSKPVSVPTGRRVAVQTLDKRQSTSSSPIKSSAGIYPNLSADPEKEAVAEFNRQARQSGPIKRGLEEPKRHYYNEIIDLRASQNGIPRSPAAQPLSMKPVTESSSSSDFEGVERSFEQDLLELSSD